MKKLNILIAIFTAILLFAVWGFDRILQKKVSKNTELIVVNTTNDSILVYLTLSGYSGKIKKDYLQDVNGVFGIKQTGLVGSFYLKGNDSIAYTSTKRFSANVSFGSEPINCSNSRWQNGVNTFEFNLNVPQESIDISAIGGVNCLLSVSLRGGANWEATPSFPNVRYMYNDSMYKNTNLVGVYPYGCTNCVNTIGKQHCQTPAETPDSTNICTPTRSAGKRGGKVVVNFNGYTE